MNLMDYTLLVFIGYMMFRFLIKYIGENKKKKNEPKEIRLTKKRICYLCIYSGGCDRTKSECISLGQMV